MSLSCLVQWVGWVGVGVIQLVRDPGSPSVWTSGSSAGSSTFRKRDNRRDLVGFKSPGLEIMHVTSTHIQSGRTQSHSLTQSQRTCSFPIKTCGIVSATHGGPKRKIKRRDRKRRKATLLGRYSTC